MWSKGEGHSQRSESRSFGGASAHLRKLAIRFNCTA